MMTAVPCAVGSTLRPRHAFVARGHTSTFVGSIAATASPAATTKLGGDGASIVALHDHSLIATPARDLAADSPTGIESMSSAGAPSKDTAVAIAQPASNMTAAATIPDSRMSKLSFSRQVETVVYIIIVLFFVFYGFQQIYEQGLRENHLAKYRSQLSPAWVLPEVFVGIDLSDTQLSNFLSNLPLLTMAMAGYIAISRLVRAKAPTLLVPTHVAMNIAFISFLHGPPVIFMMAVYVLNYLWTKLHSRLPFAVYYGVPWIFHLAVLFSNDINQGYKFRFLSPSLQWVDDMGTGLMRWYVIFNMSTLRMLGYNYDVWEAFRRGSALRVEQEAKHAKNCVDCAETNTPCYKLRAAAPRPLSEYNFLSFLAYVMYVPLYIGGPLSTFNAYMSHLQIPQRAFDVKKGVRYAVRIFCLYLTLIALLHVNHLNLLRRDASAFDEMSVATKALYGLIFLSFLWLKFSIIWKYFRLMGLADGVEAPEDMNRCFANTTTVGDFWRDWHSSFNLWIVRYMYVPLGGSKAKLWAIIPIFLFIAVWHDIELHLLWWAGIMCVAFIPELVVGAWFSKKCKWMRDKPYYRHVVGLGGMLSTLSLIIANLFGYGTGMASKRGVEALAGNGLVFLNIIIFLFSTNQIALWERALRAEGELRRRAAVGLLKQSD
jgi:D-alanyl-lipoteichoic acid acyltransferase DltB (MBOAT superfamily)